MLKFLLRKSFWNHVDNLLPAVLVNIGFFVLLATESFLAFTLSTQPQNMMMVIAIFHILLCFYSFAMAHYAYDMAHDNPMEFKNIGKYIAKSWKIALLYSLLSGALVLFLLFSFPFYLQMGNLPGALAAAVMSWLFIVAGLTFLYLPAVAVRSHQKGFVKALVASFKLMFHHIPVVLALIPVFLFQILFSCLTVFMIPGIAGIMLRMEVLVQLIEIKEDYIAEHPSVKRSKLPWDEIFREENDNLGTRNILDTLFPFKRKE